MNEWMIWPSWCTLTHIHTHSHTHAHTAITLRNGILERLIVVSVPQWWEVFNHGGNTLFGRSVSRPSARQTQACARTLGEHAITSRVAAVQALAAWDISTPFLIKRDPPQRSYCRYRPSPPRRRRCVSPHACLALWMNRMTRFFTIFPSPTHRSIPLQLEALVAADFWWKLNSWICPSVRLSKRLCVAHRSGHFPRVCVSLCERLKGI